ncbi:uncharacterized protein [Nicotiana tomentosiformis]|uniref:uncharacterized protein n=1 Tax=Nicotiana tomentosiformis TaxID=4098 RepID=UPI00388C3B08
MGNHWERVNAIVLSWIMSSIAKNLLRGIMYASSAQAVWDDLSERINKVDGSRIFNLHKDIVTLTQGTASVDFVLYLQKLKLYQFLMELNDSYSQAGSQILMRSLLPTINQVYATIISDESQKSVAANCGILGNNQTITTGNYEIAMYSRMDGNQYQKFKKNYNIQYEL